MNNLDNIISSAFSQTLSPDETLNNEILLYRKSERNIKMKNKLFTKAVALAGMVIISCVTVYRAARFLLPSQVAEKRGDMTLAAAFESEDAIVINETQQCGGYNITLMGLVSGQDISDRNTNENIDLGSTYCVVAVEKADGTKFESIMDAPRLFVSPYVKGAHPNLVNVASLNGGFVDMVADGVLYRLMDCDCIEVFASQQVYLGVSEGMLMSQDAFIYDKLHGTLTKNPDFDGINALFDLPLDTSKADPDKAMEILKSLVG